MNKSLLVSIVIILLVIAAGAAFVLSRKPAPAPTTNTKTKTMESMNNTPNTPPTTNTNTTTPAATSAVSIKDFAFSPASITIKKGTKVTWTNNDTTTHTITENDSLTGPASGQLTPGQSYSFTFTAAGTYHYHCSIHPDMTGTVLVTE